MIAGCSGNGQQVLVVVASVVEQEAARELERDKAEEVVLAAVQEVAFKALKFGFRVLGCGIDCRAMDVGSSASGFGSTV